MNNYNIDELARQMGFNDTYLNKLKASNSYITESANQDRNMVNSQLNQTISDYEKERQDQNNQFIKDSQAAYVDYAKSINPYSVQNSNINRMGLGNSGYSESSLIGANNTYQNRYTNTKNNYDNIFANINNNIAKAKETGNIELAKIAKQEQDRLLENLYKLNDEYTAEKEREEEKRRYEEEMALQKQQWEAEMALQKQQLAKSRAKSGGSGKIVKNPPDDGNGEITEQKELSEKGQEIYKSALGIYNSNIAKNDMSKFGSREAYPASYLNQLYRRGELSEADLRIITKQLGLD